MVKTVKRSIVGILGIMGMFAGLVLTGCSSDSSLAPVVPGVTGVRADGTMSAIDALGAVRAAAQLDLNSNYANAYLQPQALSVALSTFELMKSADDPNPYVVFSTSLDNPNLVNLTSGESASFGQNPAYPEAGTYTHARLTIVHYRARITLDQGEGAGVEEADFQLQASGVGLIKNGDILAIQNGNLYWMPASNCEGEEALFQVDAGTGPRPDDLSGLIDTVDGPVPSSICVQDFYFCQPDNVSPDPYVATVALPTPVEVPANPVGQYRLVTTFDVSQSALDASATGMFMFDDVDQDGIFEPGPGETDGVGRDFNDGVNGEPQYCILPPLMTVSYMPADE